MFHLKNGKRGDLGLTFYACLIAAIFAMQFSWFENFADLKFFGGVGLPFDLWVKVFPVQSGYRVASCDAVEETLRAGSRIPVLFKGCMSDDLGPSDFVYFEESQTNVFPECAAQVERHWSYENLAGDIQHFKEWYPCDDGRPLKAKVEEWVEHDLETDGPQSELHVYMMSKEEKREVLKDFAKKNITNITPTFLDWIPCAMSNFFHDGRTAVDYFHAHMDHGLMLNFHATKRWTMIAPEYHDHFDYKWSGNANVLLKENKEAPRVVVDQERGDLLYFPSWWLHKLELTEAVNSMGLKESDGDFSTKNFGFNFHMMRKDQFTGVGSLVAQWFDITNWFYRNSFDNDESVSVEYLN